MAGQVRIRAGIGIQSYGSWQLVACETSRIVTCQRRGASGRRGRPRVANSEMSGWWTTSQRLTVVVEWMGGDVGWDGDGLVGAAAVMWVRERKGKSKSRCTR